MKIQWFIHEAKTFMNARGKGNRCHLSNSDKELALGWSNQGRLHAGDTQVSHLNG